MRRHVRSGGLHLRSVCRHFTVERMRSTRCRMRRHARRVENVGDGCGARSHERRVCIAGRGEQFSGCADSGGERDQRPAGSPDGTETDRLIVRADATSGRTVAPTDRMGTVNALTARVHDQLAPVCESPAEGFTRSAAATLVSAGLSEAPSTVAEVSDSVYTFAVRVNARSSTLSTLFPTDDSLPDTADVFPAGSFPHRRRTMPTRRRCMRCRTRCMRFRSAFTRLRTR